MKKKNIEFVKPGGLELKDRLVSIQRVTKVTKGGREHLVFQLLLLLVTRMVSLVTA